MLLLSTLMTNSSYSCPIGLNLTPYSKRIISCICGRPHTRSGCSSTRFTNGGLPYSQVCGRIRGYQFAATGAFGYGLSDIDSSYYDVKGVSLTLIWRCWQPTVYLLPEQVKELRILYPNYSCPCDIAPPRVVPILLITFVRVVCTLNGIYHYNIIMMILYSISMMSSGTVRTVLPTAHAVSLITFHGLQRT